MAGFKESITILESMEIWGLTAGISMEDLVVITKNRTIRWQQEKRLIMKKRWLLLDSLLRMILNLERLGNMAIKIHTVEKKQQTIV